MGGIGIGQPAQVVLKRSSVAVIEEGPSENQNKKQKQNKNNSSRGQHHDDDDDKHIAMLQEEQLPPPPCQPLGNLYVQQNAKNARDSGLGNLAMLPDEVIVGIFSELEAMDLLRIQGVSHSFYAFTRLEGQWKHEFIKRNNGQLRGWRGSWRRTYLLSKCCANESFLPTDALRISDVYSDVLFTPHMAARYDPSAIVNSSKKFSDNIPRIDGSSLQAADLGSKPLILTNLMNDWPAIHGENPWSLKELARRYPQTAFRAEAVLVRMSDYIQYHDSCQYDESPLYIFDADFVEKTTSQGSRSLSDDFTVPHLFKDDLFSILGDMRPDYRWLIAGPARSGSTFHCDPNATSAWNAVVTGRKLWILFPPHITPPGVMVSDDQAEVETPLSLAEWLMNFYATAKRQYGPHASNPEHRNTMLEGVCNAGEVFYVPSGWWHLVVNLEDSIAVTQNFVSRTNLRQVMNFLKHRAEQVSGFSTCSSTELDDSTIDIDESGGGSVSELFEAALKKHHPDLYEASLENRSGGEASIVAHDSGSTRADRASVNLWEGLKDSHKNDDSTSVGVFAFGFDVEMGEED